MKLKSLEKHTAGRLITLPLVGDIQFTEDNFAEIPNDKVDELLKLEFGIKFETKKQTEVKEEIKKDATESIEATQEQIESAFDSLSSKELKSLLQEFPKEETAHLANKSQMIEYLKSKV